MSARVTGPGHGTGPVVGGEVRRLRAIFARLGEAGAAGLGDDCAVIEVGGTTVALSVDASLEGVHFRTDWLSLEEIGWRATAGALSDLAAEGAAPLGVLAALGVRGEGDDATEIMTGVGECAAEYGAKVLGGDLLRADRYLVDVTVIGTVARPVRRSGAAPGESVWVTGALGGAAHALEAFRAGRVPDGQTRRRFAHPEPRLAAGAWLAARGATAMIDVSDGLATDAGHLAAASGVAIEIALERVPCWPGIAPAVAAASGEEYELVATLPDTFSDGDARELERASGVRLTRIGRCVAGEGVRITHDGRAVATPTGWDHFAS